MSKNKESKEEDESNWSYDGKEEDWDQFDRKMTRHMLKKYDVFGERLWLGEIPKFEQLATVQEYEAYCVDVWKAIDMKDTREARKLWLPDSGFWIPGWQRIWIDRQLKLMLGFIEDHAKGQVELEIINFSGDKMDIRRHLYKQFGAGTGSEIHTKERHYEKGMPEPGQVAFPKGVDMASKLRQLESRRLYFFKMCEASKRESYTFCQETKLVRIVLDNIGPEYKHCVTRILDLVKVTKMMTNVGGNMDYGNIPDAYDRSFSDAWLPSWKLLQASLISEYRSKLKAIEERAEEKQVKIKLPVAVGGFKEVQCYSCGGPHKKGDAACKAGPFDVHECAPPDWKKKQDDKKRKYGGKGEQGKGNAHPNKSQKTDGKRDCRFFNFGKGTCRNGAKCNFLHDKKQGNGNAKDQADDKKGSGVFGKK